MQYTGATLITAVAIDSEHEQREGGGLNASGSRGNKRIDHGDVFKSPPAFKQSGRKEPVYRHNGNYFNGNRGSRKDSLLSQIILEEADSDSDDLS